MEKPFPILSSNISHLYQNDAEWEAELEGELNEYEMVKNLVPGILKKLLSVLRLAERRERS